MSWYTHVIFPKICNFTMNYFFDNKKRGELLAPIRGEILEIGFGTGLSLAYYPKSIQKITAIDINPGMSKQAKIRAKEANIDVNLQILNGEHLPFADNTFDAVVSTATLCSIENVAQALLEIKRVLKFGGQFFFLEHGLSDEPKIQKWQHTFTPLQKVLSDGCHLDRDMKTLIELSGLQIRNIENYYMQKIPKLAGYMYQGIATKNKDVTHN